ncbi:transmembrane protein 253 [Paramormyrops kingsleyae]|uniref:Si:dkey-30c15.13 n=1 Tax=Paramormyrops kingsleyae TaxID=1676925 RepID=A0A3B3QJ27_9TELE|nr:uncharacterized protein LOC111858107 [Paramormyrops kingsleyae]
MTENMFQEGLYQVFFKERPLSPSQTVVSRPLGLKEAHIVRWFSTVVNTRLLITGVLQVLGSLATILTTVSFICMDLGCAVYMTAPIWAGVFYVATGGLTIHVQRKPNKVKVTALMGLNIFCFSLGAISLLTYSFHIATEPSSLSKEQRVGAYVAKGSSIFFTSQCMLASLYTLFLIWRGRSRYSPPYRQVYSPISQDNCEHTELLMESEEQDP